MGVCVRAAGHPLGVPMTFSPAEHNRLPLPMPALCRVCCVCRSAQVSPVCLTVPHFASPVDVSFPLQMHAPRQVCVR